MTLWQTMLGSMEKEYKRNPMGFLREPTISKTLHPNCNRLAQDYTKEMQESQLVSEIFQRNEDPSEGLPFRFTSFPNVSPLTVQHLYHLYIMEKYLHRNPVDFDYISEIGGGYGNFRRIVHNEGFKGLYNIFDFPLLHKIQTNYLNHPGLQKGAIRGSGAITKYLDIEHFNNLSPSDNSLLVGAFSIGEMPLSDRAKLEPSYGSYESIFIVHNAQFDGVDNYEYFAGLGNTLQNTHTVWHVPDKHKRAWFFMAKRKAK